MITIYFATRDKKQVERIRKDYGIHGLLSVNGEIECELSESALQQLKKAEGDMIQIRRKK